MYNHREVEEKWQKYWCRHLNKSNLFFPTGFPTKKKKYYVLEMFPYPSGDLHMGQFRNYVIGDTIARLKLMQGYEVLHPFGWDAFGLPAEQAAIKKKIEPRAWTLENIAKSKSTLKLMGIFYDWEQEIITCEPEYYKWTQWLFIKLFEKGLVYRKMAYVNWCPSCQTSLANEQIEDGKCWRCHSVVGKKELNQWFIRITNYAERLLSDLNKLSQWPEQVKALQRNWLGRSEGVEINFSLQDSQHHKSGRIPIFTTRADTIYGVTFLAIAPENELAKELSKKSPLLKKYIDSSLQHSEVERVMAPKRGIFTNEYAINPLNSEKVPIWIADYILPSYGTGVIMGVPAHDTRDYEFAMLNKLPIKQVIKHDTLHIKHSTSSVPLPYTGEGEMINSAQFSNMNSLEGRNKIMELLEEKGYGERKTTYRLRDWLISRQRYWGAPIPVIYCEKCGVVTVREECLPVLLPDKVDFIPGGRAPLGTVSDFIHTSCPECHSPAIRDTDTMDTFVDSSWYWLRYIDPKSQHCPFTKESAGKWLPIDEYIGGIEHACGHLIYFRFVAKFLYDIGLLPYDEPCTRLFTQGMITDKSGRVMSKSKGNAIPVGPFVDKWGADTGRITMLFLGPPSQDAAWSEDGVKGAKRFLDRVYTLLPFYSVAQQLSNSTNLYKELNRTIKKVTMDIENFSHNTAIATLMAFLNELYKNKGEPSFSFSYKTFIQLLAPFAPHISEELWHKIGCTDSIFSSTWPVFHEIVEQIIPIIVEINGKPKLNLNLSRDMEKTEVEKIALENSRILNLLYGKEIKNTVWVPNKLINFVTNG